MTTATMHPETHGPAFMADAEIPCLTDVQVATLTGIALPTIRKWRITGRGPRCYKIGGCVRYKRSDVLMWATRETVVDAA